MFSPQTLPFIKKATELNIPVYDLDLKPLNNLTENKEFFLNIGVV